MLFASSVRRCGRTLFDFLRSEFVDYQVARTYSPISSGRRTGLPAGETPTRARKGVFVAARGRIWAGALLLGGHVMC